MKRIIFSFFVLFMSVSVLAQEVSLGGKVGYSSSGLSGGARLGRKSSDGPLISLVGNVQFTELFSLHAEAGYMVKGGGYGFRLNRQEYFDYFKFKVVEVPLLAKFTIGKPRVKFIGLLGGYFTSAIHIERKFSDPDLGIIENIEYDNFSFYDDDGIKPNRFDGGLVVGTGFSVDIGRGRLFVDGRYAYGFGKWFTLRPVTADNISLKSLSHRSVSINIGYTMPIWNKN